MSFPTAESSNYLDRTPQPKLLSHFIKKEKRSEKRELLPSNSITLVTPTKFKSGNQIIYPPDDLTDDSSELKFPHIKWSNGRCDSPAFRPTKKIRRGLAYREKLQLKPITAVPKAEASSAT